jgi:DNA-binding LytR/AlgR family response regulator
MLVEDEVVLRQELRAKLRAVWPELRIVAEAADGLEALRLLNEHAPDVLFVDVELPRLSGLDVAREAHGRCQVVFVTAYDAHAVAAFEQGAVDYVLKPFEAVRLALAVRRIEQRLGRERPAIDGLLRELAATRPRPTYLQWINASDGNVVRVITVADVCYFQADAGYTQVVVPSGAALIRRSLKELAGQLDPALFWPIHRSTIVNVNAIDAVMRDLRGRVRISLKARSEKLAVSEGHAHLFRQM